GNDASASVTRPTGVVSENVAASTRTNFESETENVEVLYNEPPENVQDNVVPNTPEFEDMGEKEKNPENVMHSNASDTNTAVNSSSNESMETEVVEVNETTS
ncbi:hypothetical protein A2U01_0071302, partial [Trifolium medium]|nr:hypothetical protein [Trifolium medium]